ncbi:MAG TPA: type VI secretion system accessory protein TagJ [Candidatus Angelobacter sp.]|nr:type VI secretion system accessory protein TagJ [Candidatus Angelobacter sp.]
MTGMELFQSGKLQEAIQALGDEVRKNPVDTRRRTFLFELLCFAGEYERAEKHLDVLSDANQGTRVGTLLYRSAIHAEKTRQKMFIERSYPLPKAVAVTGGKHDDRPISSFADADERIGGCLEVFVAGSYSWISLEHIASIEVPKPKKLRDLLWSPAIVKTTPAYREMELGEVLLPVLSPLSSRHADDLVRLGRTTVWEEETPGSGDVPFGQKMFLIDEEEVPILELGKVELVSAAGESRVASA